MTSQAKYSIWDNELKVKLIFLKIINVFKEPDTYKTFCKVLENKTPLLSLEFSLSASA